MFRCKKCKGESSSTGSLNSTQVHVGEDKFEIVPTFQCLGDIIGETSGCADAISALITATWEGFRQLLPIITNHGISLRNRGNIFSSCIRKSLLYGCEKWPASSKTKCRLTSADNGMVCWICGVQLEQSIRTQEFHKKLSIISVPKEIRWCRHRYFGHLQRTDTNFITKDLKDINIRKEPTHEQVEWQRGIMPIKIQ